MKLKTPKFPSRGHHQPSPPAFPPAAISPTGPAVIPASQLAPPTANSVLATAPSAVTPASPLRKAAGGLAAPARHRNAAVMLAGAALIIVAGALAASVASSFDDSLEVLVAAGPIAEGQEITSGDFRVVRIAAGAGDIQAVAPAAIEQLEGRIAAGPIGEGAMIHPSQFSVAASEQQLVIGAALEPNQFPASGLKPGDMVRLIEVSPRLGRDDSSFTAGQDIAIGEIVEVVVLPQSKLHFSIRVSESAANVVAQRVAENRLSLALLDQSITLEQVDPLAPASPVIPLELEIAEGEEGE